MPTIFFWNKTKSKFLFLAGELFSDLILIDTSALHLRTPKNAVPQMH